MLCWWNSVCGSHTPRHGWLHMSYGCGDTEMKPCTHNDPCMACTCSRPKCAKQTTYAAMRSTIRTRVACRNFFGIIARLRAGQRPQDQSSRKATWVHLASLEEFGIASCGSRTLLPIDPGSSGSTMIGCPRWTKKCSLMVAAPAQDDVGLRVADNMQAASRDSKCICRVRLGQRSMLTLSISSVHRMLPLLLPEPGPKQCAPRLS